MRIPFSPAVRLTAPPHGVRTPRSLAFGSSAPPNSDSRSVPVDVQAVLKQWETSPPQDFQPVAALAKHIFRQNPTVADLKRFLQNDLNLEVLDTSHGAWVGEHLQRLRGQAAFVPYRPEPSIFDLIELNQHSPRLAQWTEALIRKKRNGILLGPNPTLLEVQHECLHALQDKAQLPFFDNNFDFVIAAQSVRDDYVRQIQTRTVRQKLQSGVFILKSSIQGKLAQHAVHQSSAQIPKNPGTSLRLLTQREMEVHQFMHDFSADPVEKNYNRMSLKLYQFISLYSYVCDKALLDSRRKNPRSKA